METKRRSKMILVHSVLIIGACIMILPFIWMILTSFKSVTESTSMNPFIIFPGKWKIQNYIEVIKQNNFLSLYYNTFAMMFVRVVCSVTFSAMAAYAFARLKFPGKNFLFGLVLFQMMVPTQIFIIPQFLMIDKLGMRNTVFALAFPGLVSAFGTFLLRQFFAGLPKELEEAAILDGCNIGQIFIKIMLPLVKSGLIALSIFTALFAFKDLMWPMIINSDSNAATLSSALAKIQSGYSVNYPQLMAASVLAIWPMLLIYSIFQKQFIEGISTSGGKL
ncbi:carbohydrate ABC transporter permease [Clostridium estertheticum]|uniref:carbohydrate ABC transporter permease n=1 Tax=Clostridium estertheticum TaxID=238834 RepID=UPI001C7D0448|nr:carbohydrate ABC transporter permease [Clostridium estertheticum]MBX4262464.1 carbohydrate ABC transporter permease [Clostridium estertheticum]MBX4267136.1 carbohydrate ABC transporter permease [Clostridium estertheticum]MBX4271697.1 carbohydrate ABC transporter permease [Clostridium estertheticum]WLC72266.1 carbohydrate ABC transporter permease [Clostridium estertheticum]WLC78871.1 carbohydrate ABC transporter permease [Clostridium estertheticum]